MKTIEETVSLKQLPSFCKEILPFIKENKKILFYGEMGSGKTTMIKELVKLLGSRNEVSSPTFALINLYELNTDEDIVHFDLYRLKDEQELFSIGAIDYIENDNICLIEWPQLVEPFIETGLKIEIEKLNENERKICIFNF
ncbi:MAG: tRNA (adenosine(37)-N6)-threonylcarbamoyltransferase complex ATPase subunit type 1 TsaE [Chitinophagales bacterium]